MLVLTRGKGEKVVIDLEDVDPSELDDSKIEIVVTDISNEVALGFDADTEIPVDRQEIYENKQADEE